LVVLVPLKFLPDLKELNIVQTNFNKLTELAYFPKLENLDMSNNPNNFNEFPLLPN